jgi:ATP synthase protein I
MTASQATSVVLRAAAIPTVIVGLLAIGLAALLRGSSGAVAAVLATVIVLAFFGTGQYVLGRILSSNPQLALSGALLLYITQVGVLFVLIALLKDATWLDPKVFAITVVVLTLVWTSGAVVASQRTKVLYVDPTPSVDPEAVDQ